MATNLDEINATTHFLIYPDVVEDEYFKNVPLLAYIRQNCIANFPGGSDIRSPFVFAPMIGGSYSRGDTFNITKPQTIAGLVFTPRYYETNVTEYLEDILVINRGTAAEHKLIDIDLKTAMNTISLICALDLQLNGQLAGRTNKINGWVEALNDGLNPSWDGNVYANYGAQARNTDVGDTLNSTPMWGGDAAGTPGPVSYSILEESYQRASRGPVEPKLGVANKLVYAGIKERMQVQQRFAQERDPYFGASGMRMNSAMILKDDYFPSAFYGRNDPRVGNNLTGTFVVPATRTAQSNLPAVGITCTVGEVFAWFNPEKMYFYLADHPLYGFGWTGFKGGWDHTRVAGQILAAVNFEITAPWSGIQIYGLSS